MKKVISVLLIVALTICNMPGVPSFAEEAEFYPEFGITSVSGSAISLGKGVNFNDQVFPANWQVSGSTLEFASRNGAEDYYLRFNDQRTPLTARILDAPSAASRVEFSFDWLPERARAGNAVAYVSLRDGDNAIIEFYNVGNWNNDNRSTLAYSTGGSGQAHTVIDGSMTNFYGGPNNNASLAQWYTVSGTIDFTNRLVRFTMENIATGVISQTFQVEIGDNFKNLNTLEYGWKRWGTNNVAGERQGLDNFCLHCV